MNRRWVTVAFVAVTVVVLGVGFRVLADATQSRHHRIDPDSTIELVVQASSRDAEAGQSLQELVTAQVLRCRLQGHSDLVGDVTAAGRPGRFRAVLGPAMDRTDRRQFRGCLQDWSTDHLRVEVVRLDVR